MQIKEHDQRHQLQKNRKQKFWQNQTKTDRELLNFRREIKQRSLLTETWAYSVLGDEILLAQN